MEAFHGVQQKIRKACPLSEQEIAYSLKFLNFYFCNIFFSFNHCNVRLVSIMFHLKILVNPPTFPFQGGFNLIYNLMGEVTVS